MKLIIAMALTSVKHQRNTKSLERVSSSLPGFMILLSVLSSATALNNGLALTPPMGWMSGERFGCQTDCVNYPDDCISERLITSTVDVMVKLGYLDAGYQYVALDDCWMDTSRDSNGNLQLDRRRFPSGINYLVNYIHSRGMKLGLFLDLGNQTCGGFPGSLGNLQQDAQTLARWGVDMVKVSACGVTGDIRSLNTDYPALGSYLNQTGRQILYMCGWPADMSNKGYSADMSVVQSVCNQYRSYKDIKDDWETLLDVIKYYAGYYYLYQNYTGPGSFNDADQLVVGDFGLSYNQQRFQLALWAMMSSPMFISADLRTIHKDSQDLLLNSMIISINQDPLGDLGREINIKGQIRIWRKRILPRGSYTIAIFYTSISGGPAKVSIKLSDIGLTNANSFNMTEVLSGQPMGFYKPWHTLDVEVNPTGALLFQAIAVPPSIF